MIEKIATLPEKMFLSTLEKIRSKYNDNVNPSNIPLIDIGKELEIVYLRNLDDDQSNAQERLQDYKNEVPGLYGGECSFIASTQVDVLFEG